MEFSPKEIRVRQLIGIRRIPWKHVDEIKPEIVQNESGSGLLKRSSTERLLVFRLDDGSEIKLYAPDPEAQAFIRFLKENGRSELLVCDEFISSVRHGVQTRWFDF